MERTLRLPPAFRERLALQLGEQDCARVLTALGAPCVHVLRVNLRLATPQAVHAELEAAGFELEPAPAPFDDAFVLVGGRLRDLQATEALRASRFASQNLAEMAAVRVLDPQPGESVLDLCAAPGAITA